MARFVIRFVGNGRGDLMLGALMEHQDTDFLDTNVVYEIRKVMGALTIVPVGPAYIGEVKHPSDGNICWHNTADQILRNGGLYLLTSEEHKVYQEKAANKKD